MRTHRQHARGHEIGGVISSSDDDPVVMPITGELDLHTFSPRDIPSLVPEWLEACLDAGLRDVVIVTGKGTGAQRARVLQILAKCALVARTREDGNWGRVYVTLR